MFNPWGPGIAVERALFDLALRDLASVGGVDVRADAKVVGIEREDDAGWKLSMRLEDDKISSLLARFVVLATGRAATSFFDRSAAPESSKIALMSSLPVRGMMSHSRRFMSREPATAGGTLYQRRMEVFCRFLSGAR